MTMIRSYGGSIRLSDGRLGRVARCVDGRVIIVGPDLDDEDEDFDLELAALEDDDDDDGDDWPIAASQIDPYQCATYTGPRS